MITKRLIACFDVEKGRVTKAVQFQGKRLDIAPAGELAATLYEAQIDELMLYDINATPENRGIDISTVKQVARKVFIPFAVSGGIRGINGMYEALKAGAEKISLNTVAVQQPKLIEEGAKEFGAQCVVLTIRVKKNDAMPSGYEVYTTGARDAAGLDAVEWAKQGEALGAGEICVNSIDRDGTLSGFDIPLLQKIEAAVRTPLIASGGAGAPEHLHDLFSQTQVQAAIISSMLYSPRLERNYSVKFLKDFLEGKGVSIRPFHIA